MSEDNGDCYLFLAKWSSSLSQSGSLRVPVQLLVVCGVPCNNDKDCGESQDLIQGVSICENGKCTNPFEQGCLNVMSEKHDKKDIPFPSAFEKSRICNSDDDKHFCRKPKLADFFLCDEVRIAPSNWESSIIMAWIYQILLTEILEVPVTLENADGKKGVGSFYDRTNGFTFVDGDYESMIHLTLLESERVKGDCSKTNKPCAHVLPDIWDNGVSNNDLREYKTCLNVVIQLLYEIQNLINFCKHDSSVQVMDGYCHQYQTA